MGTEFVAQARTFLRFFYSIQIIIRSFDVKKKKKKKKRQKII